MCVCVFVCVRACVCVCVCVCVCYNVGVYGGDLTWENEFIRNGRTRRQLWSANADDGNRKCEATNQ